MRGSVRLLVRPLAGQSVGQFVRLSVSPLVRNQFFFGSLGATFAMYTPLAVSHIPISGF